MASLRERLAPFARLPPAINGVALGLGGLANLIAPFWKTVRREWAGLGADAAAPPAIRQVLLCVVACFVAAYGVKACHSPRLLAQEARDPKRAPGLGALSMCCMILSTWPIGAASQPLGLVCLYVSWAGCALVTFLYLYQGAAPRGRRSNPRARAARPSRPTARPTAPLVPTAYSTSRWLSVDPSCFPATVSMGLVPVAGTALGMSPVARDVAMWAGTAIALVLTPLVACNLARSRAFAAAPVVWPLTAPWALLSTAWYASDGGARSPRALGYALPILTTVFLALTVLFTALRAKPIAKGFFNPAWAMFTFPTASTAAATLLFSGFLAAEGAEGTGMAVYAVVLSAAAAAIVLTVAALALYHVRGWVEAKPAEPSKAQPTIEGGPTV